MCMYTSKQNEQGTAPLANATPRLSDPCYSRTWAKGLTSYGGWHKPGMALPRHSGDI